MPEPQTPRNYDNLKEVAAITDFQMKPDAVKFEQLYTEFEPSIEKAINDMGGLSTQLPRPALKNQAILHFDKALRSYNPQSGAKFTSWMNTQMQPLRRYIRDHTDIAHIPDNQVVHVAKLRDTVSQLQDELGREPTTIEIADSMRLSPKTVGNLRKQMKKDLIGDEGLESFMPTLDVEIIEDKASALMMDLKPKDQLVLEHLLGLNGKAKLMPNAIADRLKIPQTQVRTSMAKIQKTWNQYYGGK